MNKRKYRQAISKLSVQELRDALVREAELREAAQEAAIGLQRELMDVSTEIRGRIQKSLLAVARRSQRTLFKPVKVRHG